MTDQLVLGSNHTHWVVESQYILNILQVSVRSRLLDYHVATKQQKSAARTDFLPLKFFPYLQKEEEKRCTKISAPSNQGNTELAFVQSYYLILYDIYGNHKKTLTHCQNESKTLTLQTGNLVFACKKCCSPQDSRSHVSRISSA